MIDRDGLAFLKDTLPFLQKLGDHEIRMITEAASKAEYLPGEIILSRDKECSGLVIVREGRLRAFFETEDGKEISLYRLLPGDICILTASCILKNISFEITLEAEKKSSVYLIPASVWEQITEINSAAKTFSMELVSGRFSEVMWVMEQMVSKNTGQRVAAFLLEQSALENTRTLVTTHDIIAKNIGTAREVVSRTLKYLENEGLVKLSRGMIQLTDLPGLGAMSR